MTGRFIGVAILHSLFTWQCMRATTRPTNLPNERRSTVSNTYSFLLPILMKTTVSINTICLLRNSPIGPRHITRLLFM